MYDASGCGFKGLTSQQVVDARGLHGRNEVIREENRFKDTLKDLVKDPMLVLSLVALLFYFVSGEVGNGIFVISAIIMVIGISVYP